VMGLCSELSHPPGAAAFGDERLLPSVFQEISKSFGASLTQLGVLTFAGALASAMMTPIAGIIGPPSTLHPPALAANSSCRTPHHSAAKVVQKVEKVLRCLHDSTTQLKAQGPSRACNESKEEEK